MVVSHYAAHRIKAGCPTPSRRWIRLALAFVVMNGLAGCGGETLGTLQVTIRLETPAGVSLSCDDLGADQVELSFFAESGDLVPHDLATVDCEATSAGWSMFGLAVTARSYHRVVLRFITLSGGTVRICTSEGRVDAVLEHTDVKVEAGVLGKLDFLLIGHSPPCAEPESP